MVTWARAATESDATRRILSARLLGATLPSLFPWVAFQNIASRVSRCATVAPAGPEGLTSSVQFDCDSHMVLGPWTAKLPILPRL